MCTMVHVDTEACSVPLEPLAVPLPEAARLLSISLRKVYYLIDDGTLPSIKLGKRRLVRLADLRTFLAGCDVVAPARGA